MRPARPSTDQRLEQRHPALGLGGRCVGQLEVHAAAGVVEALGLDAPAFALGRRQLSGVANSRSAASLWIAALTKRWLAPFGRRRSICGSTVPYRLWPWLTAFVVCVFWFLVRIVVLAFRAGPSARC